MLLKDFMPESELVLPEHHPAPPCPVIDGHSHWGRLLLGDEFEKSYDTAAAVEALRARGVQGAVNLDGEWGDVLLRILDKTERQAPGFFRTFGTVDLSDVDRPDFERYAYQTVKNSAEAGIAGLKFWKIVGLSIKDRAGRYITPDDRRLSCIWQAAAEFGLPVTFHIADPTAFFKPIDAHNERYEELGEHPDWAFNTPGLYSFAELMAMQENMIKNNPATTFIMAHVGCYSENLAQVAAWLERYPNMYIDIAERIGDLGRQPYTARRFLTRYADRIVFGTDSYPTRTFDYYPIYYRFLQTFDEYFRYDPSQNGNQGRFRICGVGLEAEVLEKLYRRNIEKLLRKA